MLNDVKSLTRAELETQFTEWHQPVYRVTQLLEWLYTRRVTSWDAMANLPKMLREKLAKTFRFRHWNSFASRVHAVPRRNSFGGCMTMRSSKAF